MNIEYISLSSKVDEKELLNSLNSYFQHIEFKYKPEEIQIKIEVYGPLKDTVRGAIIYNKKTQFAFTGNVNQPIKQIKQGNV